MTGFEAAGQLRVIEAPSFAHVKPVPKEAFMKNQFRGIAGFVVPLAFVACVVAPPEETGDGGGGDDTMGGSAGNAGSGTSGTATGGAPSGGGGTTSVGGAVPTGGAGGTVGSGGVGPSGGSGAAPPTGGANTGGVSGTAGTAGMAGTTAGGRGGAGGASGGRGGSGGTAGTAGKGGSGGTAGTAGAGGGSSGSCVAWPAATGSNQSVSATRQVSGTFDGMLQRFVGSGALGTSGQQEGQGPLFELANGATLKNVIIGNPAADGVHCQGNCTLENVWWEDVGEDAATFRGTSSSQTMTVRCSGAKAASDKVFQHNGGGTLTIQNFFAENFNKLYRSCGNCNQQYPRHVILQDVTVRTGQTLVGINTNYMDTADFDRITVYGQVTVCERYTGNSTGAEPVKTGSGPDSQYCRYETSDIIQR